MSNTCAKAKTASLGVLPVQSADDMERFIKLPWSIQAGDPCWVPPTVEHHRKVMDRKNGPFFDFGQAEYFLAWRDGRPVGRLSAHVNSLHDAKHNDGAGFFGFFECEDDPQTAHALFNAAARWLKERGKTIIRGPLGFGIYDEVGILVEGFDTLPALLLTHNPPYCQNLVESWGFEKAIDWYAMRVMPQPLVNDLDRLARTRDVIMRRSGLRMVQPTPKELLARKPEAFKLFNEAWGGNWGHVDFTDRQFNDIFKELRPVLRSEFMRFVLRGDELVAFIITIPDLNPQLQKFNGRMGLLEKLRLLHAARFAKVGKLRTILLGVKREFQRKQLHHAMICDTIVGVLSSHPQTYTCDCSLIPETHGSYMQELKPYGLEYYKTYRIYDKAL